MSGLEATGSRVESTDPYPILYVDDEEANRILFEATMGDQFPLRVVDSGAAALEVLAREPIDVLLTDYRMPRMNGVELCEQVAEMYPHVQRLLVTAYVDTQSAVDAINRGGVSRYLAKPWDVDELEAVIKDARSGAVRARLAHLLQEEIWRRERITAVASLQGQVIHDLGNAASQLHMGCSAVEEIVTGMRATIPGPEYSEIMRELADVQVAIGFLNELHTRVRGLHRSNIPSPEPLDALDMLHSASVLARAALPRRGRFVIDGDDGLRVYVDRTDLGRILVNLVRNATQAVADARIEDARVWLEARRRGEHVCISVQDNGPGVPASVRDNIFDESFTTKGDGSGIGLSTSRRLAEENGGTLDLVDVSDGARFELVLPLPVRQMQLA